MDEELRALTQIKHGKLWNYHLIRSQLGVDGYLQLSTWQMEVLKDTKQD